MIACPKCFHIGIALEGKTDSIRICSNCNDVQTWNTDLFLTQKTFRNVLLGSVDEALSSLGDDTKAALYYHLDKEFSLKKKQIPKRLNDFSFALEKLLGNGSKKS